MRSTLQLYFVLLLQLLVGCGSDVVSDWSSRTPTETADSPRAGQSALRPGSGRLPQDRPLDETVFEVGTRRAVVVGIAGYDWHNQRLKWCSRDAQDLGRVLIERGGFAREHVHTLLDDEADRNSIANYVEKICEDAEDGDTLLFAFSGHGVVHTHSDGNSKDLFLVPRKADPRKPLQCVSLREISKYLDSSKAPLKVVLLDCCRVEADGKGPLIPHKRLPSLPSGRGIFTLYSCGDRQVSREDDEFQHGLFSHYLIEALNTGRADLPNYGGNQDGFVSFLEAKNYVELEVEARIKKRFVQYGNHKQNPTISIDDSAGVAVLSKVPVHPPEPPRNPGIPSLLPVNADLVTLPSLDGSWWFDEYPWLLPDFRKRNASLGFRVVHETASRSSASGDAKRPNSTIERLVRLVDPIDSSISTSSHALLMPDVSQVQSELHQVFANSYLRDVSRDPAKSSAVRQMLSDLNLPGLTEHAKQATLEAARSLGDPHLLALVQHRLDLPGAEESYNLAIAQYTSAITSRGEDQAVSRALLALCRSDIAHWYFSKSRYREAANSFLMARGDLHDGALNAPLLEIVCFAGEALALRKMGEPFWDMVDERMTQAFAIADQHLGGHHPLRAYLHERRAWALMDQWRLSEAKVDFDKAKTLRQYVLDSGLAVDEEQTKERIFHNEHGLAMVCLFRGDINEARTGYRALREAVDASAEGATPRSRQVYLERLVNTTERLADTHLMQAKPDPEAALLLYKDATRVARNLHGTTVTSGDPNSVVARLLCKMAIAATLAGRSDTAETATEELSKIDLDEGQEAELLLFTNAIGALHSSPQPSETAARRTANLASILKSFVNPSDADQGTGERVSGLRRETCEFLLFLWARLFDPQEPASDQADVLPFAPIVFQLRPADIRDAALLRYLKPYYDLAIRVELEALESRDPVDILSHIQLAMTGKPIHTTPQHPELHFYFFDSEGTGGYALLFEKGGLQKYPLEYDVAKVQAAISGQGKLPLPPTLKTRLQESARQTKVKWHFGETCPIEFPPNVVLN